MTLSISIHLFVSVLKHTKYIDRKNVGVKALAKILYATKNKRSNAEKIVWTIVEDGNRSLKDRVLSEYHMINGQSMLEN